MFFWYKRCPDAWKKFSLAGERSGEYGGHGNISYPKSMNFCRVILTTCSRALSYCKIGPRWLTIAHHILFNCTCMAVNFCNVALVRFQKAIMDDANGRSSDSHHDLQFMQFQFWKELKCFIGIKLLSQSFMIVIKNHFFYHKSSLSPRETALRTLQNVKLFDFA